MISNQRPNSAIEYQHTKASIKKTIHFAEDGICDACRMAEQKKHTIRWDEREAELVALCDRYRREDGAYDCLVPGSGGKDSFYAAHILKYKYGMHPLTVTWAPHIYTDWGRRNQDRWIHAGFDNFLCTPNGRVHRLLTRVGRPKYLSSFPALHARPEVSRAENGRAVQYPSGLLRGRMRPSYHGNPVADAQTAQRDYAYFSSGDSSQVFFGGTSVAELKERYGVHANDLAPLPAAGPGRTPSEKYRSPSYLGYYLKSAPARCCYYYSVEHGGFEASPERTAGTYSKYNSIDDKVDDLHYWTTHVKFGIGRATYDAAQEIRSGEITREEGVALVKRFDGEWPARFETELMEYLSIPKKEFPVAHDAFAEPIMTKESFLRLADDFRSPHLSGRRKPANGSSAMWSGIRLLPDRTSNTRSAHPNLA